MAGKPETSLVALPEVKSESEVTGTERVPSGLCCAFNCRYCPMACIAKARARP